MTAHNRLIQQLADITEIACAALGRCPVELAEANATEALADGSDARLALALARELADRSARREGFSDHDHRTAARLLAIRCEPRAN